MAKRPPRSLAVSGAALAGLLLGALPARADTLAAPAGGAAFLVPGGRVVCHEGSDLREWRLAAGGTQLQPPPAPAGDAAVDDRPATLRLAEPGHCAEPSVAEPTRAVVLGAWPEIDAHAVTLNVDAGRVDVAGKGLKGMVLRWRMGDRHGGDTCRDVQAAGEQELCGLTVDRDLPADASQIELLFLPPGLAGEGTLSLFDAAGHAQRLPQPQAPARVVLQTLLPPEAAIDAEVEVGRVTLRHVEAIGSVTCVDAACELDGHDLVVRGEHGGDDVLEAHVRLRPHVAFQTGSAIDQVATLRIPLQRCPIALATPPLRGVSGQKVVVRIGGRCRQDPDSLQYFAGGSAARVVASQDAADGLYVVLAGERLGAEEVTLSLQRRSAVVGVARGQSRVPPTVHAQMELPGLGKIDFIPTNREATVVLPALSDGGYFLPLPVDGVYTIRRDPHGIDHIRGLDGATGWVALRIAYRDRALPPALRDLNLAEFSDTVDHAVKVANVPVNLSGDGDGMVELVCGGGDSPARRQRPGVVGAVAYGDRESCRLLLHRERLRPEDGEQTFRILASVNAVDGTPRPEAQLDQQVRLAAGATPRLVYIGGVAAPFDRMVVRVALLADDIHYAVATEEKLGAPPLQWSLIMGTNKVRLYATTSFPTGLFRVADEGHSGILGLNGGVLFRGVYLTREGQQSPVGLEAGMMWMGIAGDTAGTAHGQIALVAGISIGVPIANVSRVTQASIALHAWAEYEVSRAVLRTAGHPWGFVFGPSLTLGAIGVNL